MASGSGTATPIVYPPPTPVTGTENYYGLEASQTCIPLQLSDYADAVGINSLLFWGVKRGTWVPEDTQFYDTRDRTSIRSGLYAATKQIAQFMNVNLCPQWTPSEGEEQILELDQYGEGVPYPAHTRRVATARIKMPISLKRKHFIIAGQRALAVYDASAHVSYAGDYGVVVVPHGGVGTSSEVRVYYADGRYQYGPEPSSIIRDSNNFEIKFPRERLVDPDQNYRGSDTFPADWTDNSLFLSTVTVVREYNDPSVNATMYVRRSCNGDCEESTETACVLPRHQKLSKVWMTPAGYQNEQWCIKRSWWGTPYRVVVHYKSGLQTLPDGYADAIIRLAHTLMPEAPCPTGHEPQDRFWKEDRRESNVQTRERINCPWGRMDGAWYAYNFFANADENYSKGGGLLL